MRSLAIAALAALALCAGALNAAAQSGDNPFPVARGSALPPPSPSASGQAAPPEGVATGGVDFGQWRTAEPETYGRQLQTQLRTRFAGKERAEIRADLEANGFACEDQEAGRLHCRIEIMEAPCALDWYAVVERPREDAIVGFDRMCLGAQ